LQATGVVAVQRQPKPTGAPALRGSKPPPAFQLYPKDWLELTADLTLAEQGLLMRLLAHQWVRGPLPDDPVALARLCHVALPEFKRLWPGVAPQLPLDGDRRRAATWMEDYRQDLADLRQRQVEGGRRGAERLWQRLHQREVGSPMAHPSETDGSPMPTPRAESWPSPSSSSSPAPETEKAKESSPGEGHGGPPALDDADIPF
jgi:uncharacterized protein DUF1376